MDRALTTSRPAQAQNPFAVANGSSSHHGRTRCGHTTMCGSQWSPALPSDPAGAVCGRHVLPSAPEPFAVAMLRYKQPAGETVQRTKLTVERSSELYGRTGVEIPGLVHIVPVDFTTYNARRGSSRRNQHASTWSHSDSSVTNYISHLRRSRHVTRANRSHRVSSYGGPAAALDRVEYGSAYSPYVGPESARAVWRQFELVIRKWRSGF